MRTQSAIFAALGFWAAVASTGIAAAQGNQTSPPPAAPTPPPAPPTPPPAAAPIPDPTPATPKTPAAEAPPAAPPTAASPATAPAPASTSEPPSAAPPSAENLPSQGGAEDAWARPFFIKGDLSNFALRPLTRRNFIGVGGGISALPRDANTALNSFFLTVEPQLDVSNPKYNWKLGLGAPLQFELLDTRGAFEVCVGKARASKTAGGTEATIGAETAQCVGQQKDRATQNLGKLRRADWDQASDFAKLIRYAVVGGQEQPFYLNLSRLYDQSLGHGTVIRQYNPNIDYNVARLGTVMDFNRSAIGIQGMANDLVRPDVIGMMLFVRPFRPFSESIFWRSLSAGFSWAHGVNQPRTLLYEPGLFTPSFDQPIPRVGDNLNLVGGKFAQMDVMGVDLEAKVLRTNESDLKVYLDYQKMREHGQGFTLGTLGRFSYGRPAWRAVRTRAEVSLFDADYMPNFFDSFHDIFQYQYLPVGYKGSNGLTYHPTKVAYLEASHGGRRRVGGYFELTHSFLNYMTVGASIRGWAPVGAPVDPAFVLPSFPDLNKACTDDGKGDLTCPSKISLSKEQGFTALKFHAELPFRRFLQAFASYELFSTTSEKSLGLFKFNGDNEVFFSGARLMLLPILFVQAEARKYFFLQRLSNIDLQTLSLQQDQTFHSNWTFSVNVFVGYEF